MNFTTALEHSINAVFCEIGKKLGPLTVLDYAKRFGFYDDPPLETPSSERAPSGLYDHGRLFRPHDPNQVDPGRLAFGQERLQVTPLQMAMVAAGIANGGVVMQPYVGREDHGARTASTVVRAQAEGPLAGDLAGDGGRADADDGGGRPGGHRHRGADPRRPGGRQDRHGRDRRRPGVNTTSFIAFAPAERPEGRGRGLPREPARRRRPDGGADREDDHGNACSGAVPNL